MKRRALQRAVFVGVGPNAVMDCVPFRDADLCEVPSPLAGIGLNGWLNDWLMRQQLVAVSQIGFLVRSFSHVTSSCARKHGDSPPERQLARYPREGIVIQAATADPALPGRWWRPLEGEAPQALRGWALVIRHAAYIRHPGSCLG